MAKTVFFPVVGGLHITRRKLGLVSNMANRSDKILTGE